MFDPDKTLAEGALQFSQFSAGWQTYLYQNNPLLDPHKKLRNFSAEEMEMLRYGAKEKVQVEIRSNNTGRVDLRRGRPFMGRTTERVDHADLDSGVYFPLRLEGLGGGQNIITNARYGSKESCSKDSV